MTSYFRTRQVLFSNNKGHSFKVVNDTTERSLIIKRYLSGNKSSIGNDVFEYKGIKYSIVEFYQNNFASVIVCDGPETMINYYFVSFDKGKNWTYLQKDYGDNSRRFLYEDKFLYCYNFPYGLQRLKLK